MPLCIWAVCASWHINPLVIFSHLTCIKKLESHADGKQFVFLKVQTFLWRAGDRHLVIYSGKGIIVWKSLHYSIFFNCTREATCKREAVYFQLLLFEMAGIVPRQNSIQNLRAELATFEHWSLRLGSWEWHQVTIRAWFCSYSTKISLWRVFKKE